MCSIPIKYNNKTYYISEYDLNRPDTRSVWAYKDKDLSEVVEINGGTLIIKKSDIQENLVK